jgi:hypothetical protein
MPNIHAYMPIAENKIYSAFTGLGECVCFFECGSLFEGFETTTEGFLAEISMVCATLIQLIIMIFLFDLLLVLNENLGKNVPI